MVVGSIVYALIADLEINAEECYRRDDHYTFDDPNRYLNLFGKLLRHWYAESQQSISTCGKNIGTRLDEKPPNRWAGGDKEGGWVCPATAGRSMDCRSRRHEFRLRRTPYGDLHSCTTFHFEQDVWLIDFEQRPDTA